jgi:MFS transporter, PPP family, 3-phenylpropionic acid transporter
MKKQEKNPAKTILSLQYFIYFGVLGVYLPYFNLYCYHLDFTGFEIGILSSIKTVTIVMFPLIWGAFADKFQARRSIYILCNIISTLVWVFYFATEDFNNMLIISIAYGIFHAPLISFLEAFSMDILGKEKKKYGHIRVWGSINFIVVVMVVGWLIGMFSVKVILLLIFFGSLLQALLSANIPNIVLTEKSSFTDGITVFFEKRLVIFLICAFLMLVSHGAYYGFFSIHLEALGFGSSFIGLAWALASVSEILVMIKSDSIFRRFSIGKVLAFSFAVAGVRWFLLAFAETGLAILGLQLLHAATYGAFHIASVLYIDRIIPGKAKTFGQAVNNSVTYGMGISVGFLMAGYFFEKIGSVSLFVISGAIAFFAWLLFILYSQRFQQERT